MIIKYKWIGNKDKVFEFYEKIQNIEENSSRYGDEIKFDFNKLIFSYDSEFLSMNNLVMEYKKLVKLLKNLDG